MDAFLSDGCPLLAGVAGGRAIAAWQGVRSSVFQSLVPSIIIDLVAQGRTFEKRLPFVIRRGPRAGLHMAIAGMGLLSAFLAISSNALSGKEYKWTGGSDSQNRRSRGE